MNILVAPNTFKECADSVKISLILSEELRNKSKFNILEKPISDGGDGFLSVCENTFEGTRLTYLIKNVYDTDISPVEVLYSEKQQIIYIESAEIVGLKKVPHNFRNPLAFNTSNLGDLIAKIAAEVLNNSLRVHTLVIGVGGTATVDFGLGLASLFGLKLFDAHFNELQVIPANFIKAKELSFTAIQVPFSIEIITDVNTVLFGENNSIQVYSEQKGADDLAIHTLLKGFENIYNLLLNNKLIESNNVFNGSGGGLAAGLEIFLNGRIISSDVFISRILGDLNLGDIDAVITGEGAFDSQSMENKGAYVILEKFEKLNVPIFVICGYFDKSIASFLPPTVKIIEIQNYFGSKEESIKNFKIGLQKSAEEIINLLKN